MMGGTMPAKTQQRSAEDCYHCIISVRGLLYLNLKILNNISNGENMRQKAFQRLKWDDRGH